MLVFVSQTKKALFHAAEADPTLIMVLGAGVALVTGLSLVYF